MSVSFLPYQQEAYDLYYKNNCKLLITLPAGSGKSLIMYRIMEKIQGNILIVSTLYVIHQHSYNLGCIPINDINQRIILLSPYWLKEYLVPLAKKKFDLIVCDESHMFKCPHTTQTKTIIAISNRNPQAGKLLLSATPCTESVGNLQPQINILAENILGNREEFARKYEYKKKFGNYFKVLYKNEDEILNICKPYMYSNKDVPLPTQVIEAIPLQMPDDLNKIYKHYKEELCIVLPEKELILNTTPYIRMKQICAGYIPDDSDDSKKYTLSTYKAEIIRDLEGDIDTQVIIWGTFREEMQLYKKYIPNAELIMGGTKKGPEKIQDFKAGNIKTIIAHPECIGAGISLENCYRVITASFTDKAILLSQSRSRTNRINQKQQEILYDVFYTSTVEEVIYKRVKNKLLKQEELLEDIANHVKT